MYFSDEELGQKDRISEEISLDVWNGIVSIYEEFKSKDAFSEIFSEKCSDNDRICGFNQIQFDSRLKAEIPTMEIPILHKRKEDMSGTLRLSDENVTIDKYTTIDFIQFCYQNLKKAINDDYHTYFKHYHLKFEESEELKTDFRDKINNIFERNGIVFFINNEGKINRIVSPSMQPLVNKVYNTSDERLNELVKLAHDKFILPDVKDRVYSLEKIWDAFERVKTHYSENKKVSAAQLVKLVSNDDTDIEDLIDAEAQALTRIGNDFQIRHFETDKIEIKDNTHIDYLFYRMISLIDLYLKKLEE